MKIRIVKHRLDRRIIRPARVTTLMIVVAACGAAPVSAATAPSAGVVLAQQALAGQTNCAALTSTQFVLIGHTFMTRMLGPGAAQGAMTAHMQALWSAGGVNQAYRFMGQRLAGCATGNGPRSFGAMMGLMGGGMMGAGYGYGTRGYTSSSYGPAYMMGGRYGTSATMMGSGDGLSHHGGTTFATIIAIGAGVVALVLAVAGLTLVISRRRRGRVVSRVGSPRPSASDA